MMLIFMVSSVKAQNPIEKIRQKLEADQVFTAWIMHTTTDSFTGEKMALSGSIYIGIDSYKIVSDTRSFLVKDSVSIVYEVEENRVLISDYNGEDDDNSPTRFLYAINDVYTQTWKGNTQLNLISEDPFEMYTKVNIDFDTGGMPTSITAIDQTGSTQQSIFQKASFIDSKKMDWTIAYPDSAEIVDLR